jgi:hypothetical protein
VGEILNSLRADKSIAHPATGQAAKNQKERLARMDAERALIIVLGRDAVLAEIAKAEGIDRAIAAAEVFGLSADQFRDQVDMRQQQVRQSTLRYGGFDPDEDPRVVAALQDGRATMQQISAVRRQVVLEHLADTPEIIGPPGSYRDEKEQQPMPQRTLTSTNPAARFNADIETDLNAAARRVREGASQ